MEYKERTYIQKKSLAKPVDVKGHRNYRISLASEIPINSYIINKADHIRIKLRVSLIIGKFRIDMTLVKEVHDMVSLKPNKDKMFGKIDVGSFMKHAPFSVADKIELEMEYIDSKPILASDINTLSIQYLV